MPCYECLQKRFDVFVRTAKRVVETFEGSMERHDLTTCIEALDKHIKAYEKDKERKK